MLLHIRQQLASEKELMTDGTDYSLELLGKLCAKLETELAACQEGRVRLKMDELRAELVRQRDVLEHLGCERDEARAERDALREDAERYRWLKERGGDGPLMKMACAYSHSSKTNFSTPLAVLNAMTADDAIDAARGKA